MHQHQKKDQQKERMIRFLFFGPMELNEAGIDQLLTGDQKEQHFIFIDGGVRHSHHLINKSTHTSLHWIGDGDSVKQLKESLPPTLKTHHYSPIKNKSDFLLALELAQNFISHSDKVEFSFLGLSGGRLDHQLALMSDYCHWLKKCTKAGNKISATLYHQQGQPEIFFSRGVGQQVYQKEFDHFQTFSVMAFDNCTLTIQGDCDYPAQALEVRPFSSQSLSNRAFGSVRVLANRPFMIFLSHQLSWEQLGAK